MLALGVTNAWAETVFSETFGAGTTSNTAYALFVNYSATAEMFTDGKEVKTHYSGDGKVGKNNLSEANLSSGYDGASGGSGCYHSGVKNTQKTIISISCINIQNYSDLTLSFGALGGSMTHKIDVTYSIDGSTETSLISSESITNKNWSLLSAQIQGKGNSLTLYFKHTPGNTWTVRLDDIKITGTLSSETPDEPICTPIAPTLTYSATSLVQGATATATLEGNTGSGEVTYTISDDKIATVDANGTVTAVGAGTAKITATVAATGEYCEGKATATITVTPLISCSEVYNLADDATFALKEFVVTYANGKYSYIKDDTGYGLIFNNAGAYGLKAGDQVAAAELAGKKDTYNGLVEIIPTSVFADLEITSVTAPDPEVMNALPVKADMNKYVKFEDVTFASTTFSSKKVTGKINAGNITFYDQFATNATFNTSKKYDVIGAVSIYNSTIQVNFISAEEVAEPTLNVKITDADFGKVAINDSHERTLTLNGSLLTKPVTLTIEGDYFTLASNSITPTDGSISEAKIKITYKPTVVGNHTATLKITSDELAEQTITLRGQAVQQHTVDFYVNKEKQTELAKKVLSGDKLDAMPAEPTSCDQLEYPTFIGWSTSEITGTTTEEPTNLLDLNTVITSDCNYYAVFAKSTTTSGGAGSVTMAYNGGTTTNMKEGNNAATVGLDENEWAVIPAKGDANNLPGLNKDNDIRVYGVETGASNTLTITSANQIITDVTITYTSKSYNTGTVSVNGNNVTPSSSSETEATYAINASSFVIGNSTKTQLHIKSVVINYATSTTTYTYLTTCESVTPTYAVTYYLDGGSSTCETSVVVEKDGELTLCDAPTKTGHTFLNWKDQSDNKYEAGATITVSSDLTLTAQWEKESYKVTWMSLGTEVASADVEYNAQPTKPAEDPTYTCLSGTKEFVGWTTQEIEGVGVPANLYADEFPVVTEPITYYAVFAGKSAEASITTNTLTITENLGQYKTGTMTDDQGATWNYLAGGSQDLTINLRNNNDEASHLASPKFSGTVQSIVAHVKNGSASERTVYLRSSAIEKPTEGDLGETSIAGNNNSNVALVIADGQSFDQFFIQVSGGLQFKDIVVTSGIAAGAYIDYITSCEAVTSSITIEDVAMNVGDTHTINATITPAAAESAVTYTIKENTENAISLSGNTITALAEGTATITATIEDAANYTGTTVDFTVTVNPAPVTDKVVILAQYDGKWYAMKAEYLSDNTDRLVGVLVNYIDGKLYEVDDAVKPLIEWERTTSVDNVTFQNNNKYLKGKTTTVLNLEAEATGLYQWNSDYTMVLSGSSTVRTFMYNGEAFRNFAVSNAGKVVNDVLYSELPVVTAPVYVTSTPALTGQFSTGKYEYAVFAPGNLQYNVGSSTWAFAENQYDCVGEANINVGDPNYEGWIDMFGWSTSETNYGVDPRNENEYYDGAFVDWSNLFPGEGWSTLSADQWKYLLNTRPNASSLKQIARVGSVVGIMLFPDNWSKTQEVQAELDSYFNVNIYNYTTIQWADLEAAGAIFLPAAGRRAGGYGNMINKDQQPETNSENLNGGHYKHQDNTNIYCYYWTSTINESKDVSYLHNIHALGGDKYTIGTGAIWGEKGRYGQSVRLAKVTSTLVKIGDSGNTAVIEANNGKEVDVQVNRTFTADKLHTLCLPFDAPVEILGVGSKAYQLSGVRSLADGSLVVDVTLCSEMKAGAPYLVIPTNTFALGELIVDNVTMKNVDVTTVNNVVNNGETSVVFQGILDANGQTNGSTHYYIGTNSYLYNGTVDILGLRSMFIITGMPAGMRARVAFGENAATGLDNITNGENTTIKVIENGQLIIIRDGIKYNAQGQRL